MNKGDKVKDENYYQVSGWMIKKLNLKSTQLEVFAIIYGFTQDGETKFTGSISYLCEFTNSSRPTVIKALKELVEKGILEKTEIMRNGVLFNEYKVSLPVVKKLYWGSKETLLGGSKETLLGGSKETLPNNNILDNNNLDNKINIIVDYLNEKAHLSYKANSKTTQQHINARLSEGFTVEDFKIVIDKKCAEWIGTEWEKYLRPSTLFGTKFESYLNAKPFTKEQNSTNQQQPETLYKPNAEWDL